MYAKVETAKSIRSPLLYNEQKVEDNQALFLDARNYWQEKDELTLRDKQQRFSDLAVLNERPASGKRTACAILYRHYFENPAISCSRTGS
jgi:hypothetical protein